MPRQSAFFEWRRRNKTNAGDSRRIWLGPPEGHMQQIFGGVALASFAAAISGTIDSGGVRRLRLNTLFFDLAVVAQQTTCVSAMPRDHFGCASWRDKNATKKSINLSNVFIKKRRMMNCFSCVIFMVGLGFVQKTNVSRKITLRNNLEIQI